MDGNNSSALQYCGDPPPPNPAQIVYARFALAVDGYATVVIVIMGLICNTLCTLVFLQSKKKSLIYCYLLPLSLWDSVLLISSFFMYSFPQIMFGFYWDKNGGDYEYTVPVWYAIGNMSLVGPLWVVLALTVDRFAALCHPFWHLRHMIDRGAVQRRLLLISLCAILYGLPRFFEVAVITCQVNPGGDGTFNSTRGLEIQKSETDDPIFKPVLAEAPLAGNTLYQFIYKIALGLILYSLFPFCILFTLTVRIMVELRRAFRNRWKLSNGALPTRPEVSGVRTSSQHPSRRHTDASISSAAALGTSSDSGEKKGHSWGKRLSPPKRKLARPTQCGAATKLTEVAIANGQGAPLITKTRPPASDDRTNSMLLAVIMKYLISHVTPTAVDLLTIFGSDSITRSQFMSYLVNLSNFLVTVNSACNFWIYLWGSLSFRSSIFEIFGKKKKRRPSAASTVGRPGAMSRHVSLSKSSNCRGPNQEETLKSGLDRSKRSSKTLAPKFHDGYRDLTNINLEIFGARNRSNSCMVTFV